MHRAGGMDPKAFNALAQKVFEAIPPQGVALGVLLRKFAKSPITVSDIKVVILCLKEDGRVTLADDGIVRNRELPVGPAALAQTVDEPEEWEDEPDQWSEAIHAAHPMRSGKHQLYATAMEMVSHRHSKASLVALVNWLLLERDKALEGGSK